MNRRCEAGTLELGAGLEVLVSASLATLHDGDLLDVVVDSRSGSLELPAWARRAGHEVVDELREGDAYVVTLRARPAAPFATGPALDAAAFPTSELRRLAGPEPAEAARDAGLFPLGALPEPVQPRYDWALSSRDRIWTDKLASLADRAARAQWDATRDVPWEAVAGLRPDVERGVAQVMTYIAQNEYAAYYVPARYLAQVNPEYVEVLMWLASHVHDEARHVEVFTKRALAGGQRAHALAATELSLQTLLDERDFSAAALLLNVLGEGTFLDLLAFVANVAPDAATATAARLAHRDERRHVQFGIAHIRHRLAHDPDELQRLVAAVEERAAKLVSLDGLSPVVGESLVLLAARSAQPADVGEAGRAVRDLLGRMNRNRVRRLRAAGFDRATAQRLSELHTPNLM
ncbi:MAG: ferritin-like domain-containing protein [Actinomycetota bacterium]